MIYYQQPRILAKRLRENATISELILWRHLRHDRLFGVRFIRQKRIGPYIVDFYSAKLKLVIEIDGCSHEFKEEYDSTRERYLQSIKLTVIHLKDLDVRMHTEQTLIALEIAVRRLLRLKGFRLEEG